MAPAFQNILSLFGIKIAFYSLKYNLFFVKKTFDIQIFYFKIYIYSRRKFVVNQRFKLVLKGADIVLILRRKTEDLDSFKTTISVHISMHLPIYLSI